MSDKLNKKKKKIKIYFSLQTSNILFELKHQQINLKSYFRKFSTKKSS